MTTIPFGPQLVGRTEKALNALLDRQLAGTGLTEPQWVALHLSVGAGNAAGRIAEALRVDEAAARRHLADLAAAGLVAGSEPTERGLALWQSVRAATARLGEELWGDLPAADRDAAARVLTTVLERAGRRLRAE